MSWGAIAAVGSSLISAYGANKAASKSAGGADQSAQLAYQAQMESLEFDKERYEDWKGVFGDVQQQLSRYYTNLNPERYSTRAQQAFTEQLDQSRKQVIERLEQAGIATSGIRAQAELDFSMFDAETRAKIRADAPRKVAEEKSSFLNVGLGQNPARDVSSNLRNQAQTAAQQAGIATRGAASAELGKWQTRSDLVTSVGNTVEQWASRPNNDTDVTNPGTGLYDTVGTVSDLLGDE